MALGLPTLEDKELDYLLALLAPKKMKSYYDEFTSPKHIIEAIMGQIPKIREEQPELAKKIETLFKATIEEILGAGIKQHVE
jgi:hypothetical protein